jgi:2'-5' RNA ligase
MPRLFIGIQITNTEHLKKIQEDLKKILSKSLIKWVDPENFHITLKFLGEVDSPVIEPLIQVLEHLTINSSKFILNSNGFGIFGPQKRPRAIYYGFQENSVLISLQRSIEKSLSELGFDFEEKSFSPHLTLGRVKSLFEKEKLLHALKTKDEKHNSFEIKEFQLIKSNLTQEGPNYRVIKNFKLN